MSYRLISSDSLELQSGRPIAGSDTDYIIHQETTVSLTPVGMYLSECDFGYIDTEKVEADTDEYVFKPIRTNE